MSVSIKQSKQKLSASPGVPQPELTVISKVIKGDTYLVIADAAKDLDDEFVTLGLYSGEGTASALEPPYPPKTLRHLVQHNNVLNQCVHAMEVNVDGTGHEFVSAEEGKEPDKKEEQLAKDFFNEPYPGKSFVSMRRDLRRDIESIGWGALEVLRNLQDEVVGVRNMEAQYLRLAKLGNQVQVEREVVRSGKPQKFKVYERPRRFIQVLNGKVTQYFKEFNCPLDLNRKTGEWAESGKRLKPEERATEILFFGVDRDVSTPYFVPRWINQLPSVVGSRKAEEQNLEFFDAGGMPPAIIFIQGGTVSTAATAEQLRTYLSAQNKRKGRAVVVELTSTAGTIDSGGSVTAKVERFGAERANDAMYANYDKSAEEHVRVGFRLPPLFLGRAQDYNYATAVVAYQVAEAQVFQPERTEFDEVVNNTLIKALGLKTLKFKSLPITMKSVEETFKGLALLDGKVEPEEFVNEVNKAIGSALTYKEPPEQPPPPQGKIDPLTGLPYDKPVPPQMPQQPSEKPEVEKTVVEKPEKPVVKMDPLGMIRMARRYAEAEGLVDTDMSEQERVEIKKSVVDLGLDVSPTFLELTSVYARAPEHPHVH